MENSLLWRVVYTRNAHLASDSFSAGPWHPDKKHVERCAAQLRHIQPTGIQSNAEAARKVATWPG